MKRKKWALKKQIQELFIQESNRETHLLPVCAALGFSEQWIVKVFSANKINGPLTLLAAQQSIMEVTGIKSVVELYEEIID